MSYSQEEEIEMAEVYCRNPKHEGEFIRTLCLNTEC